MSGFAEEPGRTGCDNGRESSIAYALTSFAEEPERAGCDNIFSIPFVKNIALCL